MRILFLIKNAVTPSGGVGVIYSHVKVLRDLGYDAIIVHPDGYYHKQDWLGEEYTSLPHKVLNPVELNISAEDLFVFGECFALEMRMYKDLPCKKVVLCQSHIHVRLDITENESWSDFGVEDIIVVQKPLEEYIKNNMSASFNFHYCPPAIDELYFNTLNEVEPTNMLAVSCRNHSDFEKIKNELYPWVNSKDMHGMTRIEYAYFLKISLGAVWVDDIAGFGTFPIEAEKSGIPLFAVIPRVTPEYIEKSGGKWFENIDLLIQDLKNTSVNNLLTPEKQDNSEIKKLYTKDIEYNNIKRIYKELTS